MQSVGGAVQIMLFVYALAAVVSLAMAWIIKLIFAAVKMQKARADGRTAAAAGAASAEDAPDAKA